MQKRCIMIFPRFNNGDAIDAIRKKYDPLANHVRPHITLVFPFDSDLQPNELKEHLAGVLSDVKPFDVVLRGITPSKGHGNYLFLNVESGREEITEIHKRLYTGLLEKFLPVWLQSGGYCPHLTVGKIENEEEYKAAIEETGHLKEIFKTTVDTISVEIIDENQDSMIEMEIPLR